MTLPPQPPADKPKSSVIQAMLAAILASFLVNQLSLAGVNFETLGVSSEIVKSTIVGNLVVFFAWVTPANIATGVRSTILFTRSTWLSWRSAAEDGKE